MWCVYNMMQTTYIVDGHVIQKVYKLCLDVTLKVQCVHVMITLKVWFVCLHLAFTLKVRCVLHVVKHSQAHATSYILQGVQSDILLSCNGCDGDEEGDSCVNVHMELQLW
jgi:hypothetical protein